MAERMKASARNVSLRPARAEEAELLTALALRSKAYWGYGEAFMAACRDELVVHASEIVTHRTTVAVREGNIVGFATLKGEPPVGELGMLFVDPDAIGQGVGSHLYEHVTATARELGFARVTLDADPYAEPFHLAMSAIRIGLTPSGFGPGAGTTTHGGVLDLTRRLAPASSYAAIFAGGQPGH